MGGHNTLTILQLTAELQQRIPELTAKYRGVEQFPLAINSGQDFPLVLKTIKASPIKYTRPKEQVRKKTVKQKKKCSKSDVKELLDLGFTVKEALTECAK